MCAVLCVLHFELLETACDRSENWKFSYLHAPSAGEDSQLITWTPKSSQSHKTISNQWIEHCGSFDSRTSYPERVGQGGQGWEPTIPWIHHQCIHRMHYIIIILNMAKASVNGNLKISKQTILYAYTKRTTAWRSYAQAGNHAPPLLRMCFPARVVWDEVRSKRQSHMMLSLLTPQARNIRRFQWTSKSSRTHKFKSKSEWITVGEAFASRASYPTIPGGVSKPMALNPI